MSQPTSPPAPAAPGQQPQPQQPTILTRPADQPPQQQPQHPSSSASYRNAAGGGRGQPQQQQQQQQGPAPGAHRGGGGGGGRGGGRYPQQQQRGGRGGPPSPAHGGGRGPAAGGRHLYDPQRGQPINIHGTSGVPFGHVPAYLPGSASLIEDLDQNILIVLRDGKHLIGKLCSYDQFSNLVLQNAIERRFVRSRTVLKDDRAAAPAADNDKRVICYYADIPIGIYVVRGDSMVFMGRLRGDQQQAVPPQQAQATTPAATVGLPPPSSRATAFMKQVTLNQLEEIENDAESRVEPLDWDFDADLTA